MRRAAVLAAVVLLGAAGPAGALAVGVGGWVGDYGFSRTRLASDTSLPGADWFWGPSVHVTQPFSDTVSLDTGFRVDPVLRNFAWTLLMVQEPILTVGAGPFFGMLNGAPDVLQPGISTLVRLEVPGIAFIDLRSDSSIGGSLLAVGDYSQDRQEIGAGFYVRNVMCTLSYTATTFSQRESASTIVADGLTSWALRTDISVKNVPYRAALSAAWQTLERSWISATTTSHLLHSVVLGAELTATIARTVTVVAGVEGTVYAFAEGAISGSSQAFLFRASTGVTVDLDSGTVR